MTTLSYLVEAVRGDVELPGDAGSRLELLSLEMSRLLDIIAQEIPCGAGVPAVAEVGLRSLAGQVTKLARIAHETSVVLEPGPEVTDPGQPGPAVAGADQRGGQRGPGRRAGRPGWE